MMTMMTTMTTRLSLAVATVLVAGSAHAVTQPPHDAPGGTECVQCHIPYGGANASSQATGTATAGWSSTTLADANKAWIVGAWTGGVLTFTSGANNGSYRTITANTATSVSWTGALAAPIAVGDSYQIGKTTYDDIENKCRACHSSTGTASTMADVGLHVVNGGTTVIGCGKCHEPHNVDPNTGRGNGLLRLSIRWPTATVPLAYPASAGNRFIATSAPFNGICQICHTQTKHHRNDGTLADHYPTMDCTTCHPHGNRFEHGGGANGGTGCGDCHGHASGYPLADGSISVGAGTSQSHATHTQNDSGHLRGPNVDCSQCHNTNAFPFFNSGTDVNGDGTITLDETDVCESCHSSSGTYDGVNDPAFGAKPNWPSGIYAADNLSLQPGKDRWCAGCHDEAPALVNNVQAPWVAGEESVVTDWGTTGYGFYKTGHGLPSSQVYPWTLKAGSSQQRQGAGLACDACHDTTVAHVDGVPRSYSLSRTPAGYQAGYRLKSVAGGVPMQIPRQGSDASAKPEDFPLCLSCHNARPFTSASAMATNYRDDTALRNDHNFHLSLNNLVFRSDWATDASAPDSRPTCITCHNVHGSTMVAMVNDGLLTSRGLKNLTDPSVTTYLAYANAAAGTPPVGLSLADSNHTAWSMNQTQYSSSNSSGLCSQNCHYNSDPNHWDFYVRSPFDNAVPQILVAYGASASNVVSLRFSKPVYGPTGLALQPTDLTLVDASGRTITAVDHVAGGTLALLTLSTALDGSLGSDTLAPSAGAGNYDRSGIYDQIGNRVPPTPVTITTGDMTAPTMTITSPASGAAAVSVDSPLTFTLADTESGVLWSSLTVTLSGSLGYAASLTAVSPQLTHTGSASSYTAILTPSPSFGYGETITVAVQATDVMGNVLAASAWSFTTAATPLPITQHLYASGAGSSTDSWSISPLNSWSTSLRTNDDGSSYAQGSGTASTFYVNLDDPPSFGGAVQSIVVNAYIQINAGTTGTYPFTLGWRVGVSGLSGSASMNVSGPTTPLTWSLVSVDVPIGASLAYADIVALQAFVGRSTTGTHTDRVTQLWADVTYLQ